MGTLRQQESINKKQQHCTAKNCCCMTSKSTKVAILKGTNQWFTLAWGEFSRRQLGIHTQEKIAESTIVESKWWLPPSRILTGEWLKPGLGSRSTLPLNCLLINLVINIGCSRIDRSTWIFQSNSNGIGGGQSKLLLWGNFRKFHNSRNFLL